MFWIVLDFWTGRMGFWFGIIIRYWSYHEKKPRRISKQILAQNRWFMWKFLEFPINFHHFSIKFEGQFILTEFSRMFSIKIVHFYQKRLKSTYRGSWKISFCWKWPFSLHKVGAVIFYMKSIPTKAIFGLRKDQSRLLD
jgi:hypothetical protein